MKPDEHTAVVVGGGIAGLTCARDLLRAGKGVTVLEASCRVGGRVQSDHVDGFTLDHGFQVFLDAYPEAKRILDYPALHLHPFGSGSLIYDGIRTRLFADPIRHPRHALASLFHSAGTLQDKIRLHQLRMKRKREDVDTLFAHPDMTTLQAFKAYGFSDRFIQQFLRPFYRGIFLENELSTSRRMFEFTFSMFSRGRAMLPAGGMQAISNQLASQIGSGNIRLNCRVKAVDNKSVTLESGEMIHTDCVVRAHADTAAPGKWNAVTCLYFKTKSPPYTGPWLTLNGSGAGMVNQIAIPSNVAPGFAPEGQSLISVSINGMPEIDDEALARQVRDECRTWFDHGTESWEFIKAYRIPRALPGQPVDHTPRQLPTVDAGGVFVCGDYTTHASLQGAMHSGRRAAEAVLSKS